MSEPKGKTDAKTLLSTLWVFITANYIFCDVLSNMESGVLKSYLDGKVGGIDVNQRFLLGSAIMMEIPFAMILLSRILGHKANRWANVVAGAIMAVIQVGSMFFGTPPTAHYIFYSIAEIGCALFIAWYALRWKPAAAAGITV